MKKIVFATNNANKLREIREILEGTQLQILSLNDIGCHEDIPEVFDTLEMNSHVKAAYIAVKYGYDCFADDTGLEVDALGGEPGVHSARYAEGTDHDSQANMRKLLAKLGNNNNRRARFRTVITLATQRNLRPVRIDECSPMATADSATTPYSCHRASPRVSPRWGRRIKTASPTAALPCASSPRG